MSFQYKYLIPYKEVAYLQEQIKPFTQLTSLAATDPTGDMTVRNIYFDTPNFDLFSRKREKLVNRKNVILRAYNLDENKVFLETFRQNEEISLKTKATVPYDRVKMMFKGEIYTNEFLWNIKKKEAASRFFFQIHRFHLRPVLKIVNERIPYKSIIPDKENDFKMVIQRHIRCSAFPTIDSLFEEEKMTSARPNVALLIVKYNRSCPAWLKPILAELNFTQGRLSKYRLCMEALPEINTQSQVQGLMKGHFFTQNAPRDNGVGAKIDLLQNFNPIIPDYKLKPQDI